MAEPIVGQRNMDKLKSIVPIDMQKSKVTRNPKTKLSEMIPLMQDMLLKKVKANK